jgi:FKBP-type peptidyl-prolyl cis-trans isomerase
MSKNYYFVFAFFALLVVAGAFFVNKIPSSQNPETSGNITSSNGGETLGIEVSATPTATDSGKTKMENKLKIEDEVVGTGTEAVIGKKITVNYKGTLLDGTKFDSSYDRNEPFSFNLGAGEVIQGWDQGFSGMKIGGKRKLTIPPSLGYGSSDLGTIPPNSTLVFEVELLKVE